MVTSFELGNLLDWYRDFFFVAKCEDQKGHECADQAQSRQPPDVPDQRETGDDGEEGIDEAERTILRHLDRPVLARLIGVFRIPLRLLLCHPEGINPGYLWQD